MLLLAVGCHPVSWELSYERGMKRAAQQGRRAVVQFYSAASKECRAMDEEVFTKPQVQQLMKEYVPIRLDTLWNRKLMEQFGVQVVPAFCVLRPDASMAASYAGKMDAEKFRYFLIKYRHN